MAKRRFIITVSGRVQRVGFRDFAAEIARKLRLTGEVKNSEDPSQVVIVAEGEKSTLEEVVAAIKSAGPPAEIENIEIKEQNPTGEFRFFRIARGDPTEELGERLDIANTSLHGMIAKQDGTIKEIREMRTDLKGEIGGMRADVVNRFDVMEHKYGKISVTLERISNALEVLAGIRKS